MLEEIQALMDKYVNWLKDKTVLKQINGNIEITTPYLDRHNDYIQLYVNKVNGNYLLTDDGYTLEDLKISGCDINTPKRKRLLDTVVNGFGVQLKSDHEISVLASPNNFHFKKHSLIQAILAINDLFYIAEPFVKQFFVEDVANWLTLFDIRFVPNAKFAGRSGFDHMFSFAIPKSKSAPERLVRAINNPNRDNAEAFVFSWIDTKENRDADSKAYAFLNDTERTPTREILDALQSYDISPVPWSQRATVKDELAA